MATNFPTTLDTLTNPTATDKVSVVSHADQHIDANDAIEALEAKVGADGSAVTTTHDYKLSNVAGSDKAVSLTGAETLTNKTLTTPVISTISNTGTVTLPTTTDTLVGRDTTDTLTNKTLTSPTINSGTLSAPVLNGSITGTGVLDEDNMSSDSATSLATQQSIKAYVDNAVISGQPESWSPWNMKSASTGVNYTDEFYRHGNPGGGGFFIVTTNSGGLMNDIDISSSTWADTDSEDGGWVILNNYMYGLLEDSGTSPDTFRVYRYSISNITAAGTLMTFSGATTLAQSDSAIVMTSDGTNFYFSFEAGNSANQYVLAKYTLSGTTLTYDSSITLSDSATFNGGYTVDGNTGDIYTLNSGVIKRYNSSGTLQETSAATNISKFLNFSQTLYVGNISNDIYSKLL